MGSSSADYRLMSADEKIALRDVIRAGKGFWENEEFAKSQLWDRILQWVPPPVRKNTEEYDDEKELSTKSIYLQVMISGSPNHGSWFTVKDWLLHHKGKAAAAGAPTPPYEVLPPIPGLELCELKTAVVFPPDSGLIVTLGGSYRFNCNRSVSIPEEYGSGNRVKTYDLAAARRLGFQDLPRMLAERDFPTAVVVEGKIYVFGGRRRIGSRGDRFIEVYDPDREEWQYVNFDRKPPLFAHIPGGLFVDDEGHRHLLFHSDPLRTTTTLYTYNLDTCEVNFAETPFPELFHGAVVIDGTLYAYLVATGDVRAYDLATKRWMPGAVAGLDVQPSRTVELKHICGKYLCAIYEDRRHEEEDFFNYGFSLTLVVTVFKLVQQMKVEVHDSRSFLFPRGAVLSQCIII